MKYTGRKTLMLLLAGCSISVSCNASAQEVTSAERATLARIRDNAMHSDWGYQRLADLADLIGPRLSGSAGAEAAVAQVTAALKDSGIATRLEPVMVPHWQRGLEEARLVSYAGRPDRITQKVVLTALGHSTATPPEGLTAPIVVVHDFDELAARAGEVKGKIVLFDEPFDSEMAENGYSGEAYGKASRYRFNGPARAAQLGAAAVLVRSVGGAAFRIPHAGDTVFPAGTNALPAAAVSVEDAMLIERLSQRGEPVVIHLTLTPSQGPDVPSSNVIGEIPGSDPNAGIVIVSGHLDSWDLGTGAMDDGIGVISAMAAMKVFKQLDLHPRRTIRFVAWMNEEDGLHGAEAYAHDHHTELARHMAAIESDFGLGKPLGVTTNAAGAAIPALKQMITVLEPIGATIVQPMARGMGSDLDGIQAAGVPIYEPLVDGRRYFDIHHTAADTLDKVDPVDFKKQVAVMAVLTYFLADQTPEIPREILPFAHR
jgi:Zn-dependent M28 family amino/carboxypeptidase